MAHRAEGPNSLSMAGWTDLIIDLAILRISLVRVARFGALAPRWRFQNWDGAQKFHCGAERQMALWQLKWRSLWRFDSWDGAYYEILTIEMALWQKNDQKQAKNDQNFKKKIDSKKLPKTAKNDEQITKFSKKFWQ